jgi:hypothetical protein
MGGKSNPVRYNSEVGILFSFVGAGEFDPMNPEKSIASDQLINPTQVYKDIKNLLGKNYDERIFNNWVDVGHTYKSNILDKVGQLPTRFGWSGGLNVAGGVTDITFENSQVAGISVKAEGGITLSNLTPKSVGIEVERGIDVFSKTAKKEYDQMKQSIVTDVLVLAKSSPDTIISPLDPKYSITYISSTDTFRCTGKKSIDWTQEKILTSLEKNAEWQRVFGDWFQANWRTKKSYAAPLFQKVAKIFEVKIENHLQESSKLAALLRFGSVPYFYATPKQLFYIPSHETISQLEIKGLKYSEPDGTSQRFFAQIGVVGSEQYAELDIYVRYANGMFEKNPTVRIQSLKNPQYISWELQ